MPSPPRSPSSWTRRGAFVLLALSLLTLLPAPVYAVSALALVVTEWGHVGALAALLLAAWLWMEGRQRTESRPLAIGAALAALVILSAPAGRAALLAKGLPDKLSVRFGPLDAAHRPAGSPFDFTALFRMARPPGVTRTTVVYTSHGGEDLGMDVFRHSSGTSSKPAVVVIHGGSWQGGTREEFRAMNEHLAATGLIVASIDYRLAPRWRFPAALDDVRSSIAYLKTHAHELGVNADRIALVGRSAGTALALLAAYANPDPSVRGVVALYGPADMRYGYEHPSNPWILDSRATLRAYLGGSPADAPEVYDAASPVAYVSASTPPTLLIHGSRDQLVTVTQSARLDDRLARAGRAHFFLRLPWAMHACDYNLTGPCGQLSSYAVDYFLKAVFR